ncbi:unnamed protein product [Prorocentrum cordatum]|uniref:Uncharacterized protein n=1 Tax=Prorocentrum cordatum TaxID=2364126 RepID=A0ABN9T6N9_9DINO|nr:unnamed protein product [Polarella glacialis]
MGLARGPLSAIAAGVFHGLVALGAWRVAPPPVCPRPVCPAAHCPSPAGLGPPGGDPPAGPAALLAELPEELAEVRAAAARLDDRLAVLQATAGAVASFWPLIWALIGGLVKGALDRLFAADGGVVKEPAFMSEMRPGRRFALWYSDDTYWHERVALACVRPGAWVIATPDGDGYPENLRCRRGTSGAVQAVEQVKMAEAESYAITRRAPAPPAAVMMWVGADVEYEPLMASEGVQLVPLGGGGAPVHGEGPALAPLPPPELPPDATWLIVDPHHPDFGRERHPGPDAPRAGEYAIALDAWRRPVPVRQVALADVETFMASARTGIAKILEDEAGPATGHLEERLHRALDGGAKTPPSVEDARTLTVDYDEHGKRYKEWRSVCAEISYSHFGDWDKHHEGPATTLALFKNIQRQGGDPRLWYASWCREAGVSPQERMGIEMKLLTDILYLSGCYDQLNGPSLACIETVARRVCQIIEAYSAGVPGRANWEGVKHFTQVASASYVAPAELRSHVHRRAKEEMEIESMRVRTRGLQPPGGPEAVPPGAPVNPKGTPKGGGRGRGQPVQGAGQEGGGKVPLAPQGIEVILPGSVSSLSPGQLTGAQMSLGLADVKDAFHRFRIPSGLVSYFGFGSATAGELSVVGQNLDGVLLGVDDQVDICWASLPMGFSWSLYFCQQAGEQRMKSAPGLTTSTLLQDRGAPGIFRFSERFDPSTGTSAVEGSGICHHIYVVNLGVISCDPVSTSSALSDASDRFEKIGLRTHEHEVTSGKSKALGTHLDLEGFRVSLSPARFWKVRQGVLCALRCRKLPGRAWEVLLGHLTFCALINRSMMSVLRGIYAFINKHYCVPTALWETARQEMTAAASLPFVMDASWTLPWAPSVVATDASEEGFGATVSYWAPDKVAQVGGIMERRRFKRLPGASARERFSGSLEDLGSDGEGPDDDQPYLVDSNFPEVPRKQLSKANWDTLLAGPWKCLDEGIYTLESRPSGLPGQAGWSALGVSVRPSSPDIFESAGAGGAGGEPSVGERPEAVPVGPDRLQGLGLLPLEANAVKATAENQYHELVTLWRPNARDLGEPLGEAAEVDASVARQLQDFFDQGENVSKGEKLVAGLEHFLPEFGRHGGLHLSRSYRALRGWRRRRPPRSRRPLAFCIWAAIIWEFCQDNLWNMAVYTLIMLVTYMRPSEPLKLLQGDLLAPAHGLSASWICFAFRQERGQSSKTYATDESIELSCQWAPFLATVAAALKRGRPKEKVFSIRYSSRTRQFKTVCRRLGLTAVPYQARRSGASIDAARKYRTRAEIKARGRWKADKSVLRYDSKAKIVESVDKLPDSLAPHVRMCELRLWDHLCGQIDPSAIALPDVLSSGERGMAFGTARASGTMGRRCVVDEGGGRAAPHLLTVHQFGGSDGSAPCRDSCLSASRRDRGWAASRIARAGERRLRRVRRVGGQSLADCFQSAFTHTAKVNYFTNLAIVDCLTEGCPVEELIELEGRLSADEAAIHEHLRELRDVQERAHSPDVAEALAWFGTVAKNSQQLRDQFKTIKDAQAEHVKAIKDSEYSKEFAASLVVQSDEAPGDYLNEGTIAIWRMLSRSGKQDKQRPVAA